MTERLTLGELFDRRIEYPDVDARRRLTRLVGIDETKSRLAKDARHSRQSQWPSRLG